MRYAITWQEAVLRRTQDLSPDVRLFEIAPTHAARLPYAPGSHINVGVMIGERPEHRSYSLVGEPDGDVYRIAVKRARDSRGGSAYMWSLSAGTRMQISEPHNLFGLDFGRPDYLLVAGGIGITPLVGMASALQKRGARLRIVYACRGRGDAVFAERLGAGLELRLSQDGTRLDIAEEIARLAPGGQMYFCGPVGLLDAARAAWEAAGRPPADLRFETFGSGGRYAPQPFRVKIPRLGLDIAVGAGQTMLDALETAGVEVMSDCLRGECGLCALDIIGGSGQIDHRDVFFSDAEKRSNAKLCACVSRVVDGDVVVETALR